MNDEPNRVRSFVGVWARRALTISGCLLIWLLLIAFFPLLLVAGAIIDLWRGVWVITRCVLFFPFYFSCEVFGIIASFVIWLASGVWGGGGRERFLDWNFALQRWWANALCRGALRIFRISIEVEGADELRDGPVIVFLRHASVADTLLPAVFIANPNGLRLRYVLKRELLLDPCLDIVGNRLPNSFVRRNSGDSYRVVELMSDLGPRDGVIIYPEGTRFTEAKRERIFEEHARKGETYLCEKARALRNVLPPRLGGPLNLLEHNDEADVVFCAHSGFDGVVNLRDFLRGSLVGRIVRVRFWRVPFASIPRTREARTEWLFENWARVDEWVGRQKDNEVVVARAS
jgi:1-acyl-sn-glycerol-3-phosphate acyltransferase